MTDSDAPSHPHDRALEKQAYIFHAKLDALKATEGEPSWEMVLEAAAASHFLFDAKIRTKKPDIWEHASSLVNLMTLAANGASKGNAIIITEDSATEMIFRAHEDPDYFETLKLFCSRALSGEPITLNSDKTFTLHPLLSRWLGKVSTKEIRKPKTRKNQLLASKITNDAIANTVQFLHDAGLPIFRNDATRSSINACDAVAEIYSAVTGRKGIGGHAVQKIYYNSEWAK